MNNDGTQDIKELEIQASFSYDPYEMVRREMFAHIRSAQMTIRKDSVSFNQAIINALPDTVYIQIMVSRDQKRVAIRGSNEDDKDSIRWCTVKNGKHKPRKIGRPKFGEMVFEMMGWEDGCRYKALGHHIIYEGRDLFVFELEEAEMYKERPRRTKVEKEQMAQEMTPEELTEKTQEEAKASRVAHDPEQFIGVFGVPVNEHQDKVQLQSLEGYTSGVDLLSQQTAPAMQADDHIDQDLLVGARR